jgi:cytochrome d ubiquinol oxidase subunit II
MNPLYLTNHLIFAVFMTLLLLEGGFAITSLIAYKKYKERLMRYITPIWEVTGTFAVFYIVNFEATFPTLLGAAGTLYAVPLLVAAALIIIRNAFLIYSVYVGDSKKEGGYLKVYALATIAALVLLLSVLSSAMSGIGVSPATGVSTASMYLNPFNILVIASALLVSLSLATSLFRIKPLERLSWMFLIIAIALFAFGTLAFVKPVGANIMAYPLPVALLLILVIELAIMQANRSRFSAPFAIFIVFFAINVLGVLQYPYIFGSADITGYLNNSALTQPIILVTLVGGAIVAIALSYLVYLSYLRKRA